MEYKIDNVVDIMIGAIRAQVCGCEYVIDKDISEEILEKLFLLSKSQDVAHIVSSELERQGVLKNDKISEKFRRQQMLALLRYERINYELKEICRALEEAKISYMPLKGAVIRNYYPEPWMRTSADIDLLVHEEDLFAARDAIKEKLCYTSGERNIHDISMFSPNGVHLELHFNTVEEEYAVNSQSVMKRIWDYAELRTGYSYCYDLFDEMFYFYHIAHMAKHFEYGGCGIRFFLDLWLINNSSKKNLTERKKLLAEGGLLRFANVCEDLCEVWFSGGKRTDDLIRIEEHVILNGIYGTEKNNIAWQQITKGGKNKYALRMFFLPYENMIQIYPALKKHKCMLPLYHIRRWFSAIRRKRIKASIRLLKKNSVVANSYKDDVANLLRELELI